MSIAALAAFAWMSSAGSAEQKADFASLDKNGDDQVSVNEAAVNDALFVAFKDLDTNKDGELTREEFARYKGK
jgi:hypothetical protein